MPNARVATLYGIANCDTVKKARAFLAERAVPYAFHDFKKLGVPPERLTRWIESWGWEPLLNRKGSTWRKLDVLAQRRVVDAGSARELMLGASSVITRTVVEWPDDATTVGFDATRWSQRVRSATVRLD